VKHKPQRNEKQFSTPQYRAGNNKKRKTMKVENMRFVAIIESHNENGEKFRYEFVPSFTRTQLIHQCEKLGIKIGLTMPYSIKGERGFPIELSKNKDENRELIFKACFVSLGEFKHEPILLISKKTYK